MSILQNPFVACLIAVVGFFIIWFFLLRKKVVAKHKSVVMGEVAQNKDKKYDSVQAYLLDNTTRQGYYNAEISGEDVANIIAEHESIGRLWNQEGKYMPALVKYGEGKYRPIYIAPDSENDPTKLHSELQHPYLDTTMDMQKKQSFMQQYGGWIWITLAAIGAITLIMMARGG